ncbi:MAG: MBL fold metallo-hydrolase [Deltaproteobacteria bacterium]|nr:MBL fold metallo-hydrolase [Candidatus Zymogenaceae bacterium]
MKKFLKVTLIVIACLAVIGFVGKYFLVDKALIPTDASFTVDMDEIRRLATSQDGGLPAEIRALVVAEGAFPSWMVAAGGGGGEIPIAFVAYQIVYADKTVVIDTAAGRAAFEVMPFKLKSFSDANYEVLQESLKKASLILITHEHFDHIGGIAASPYLAEILPHVLLTTEQFQSFFMKEAGFPAGSLDDYAPLSYDGYYSPAPGVVLIKAPGHAPGQQMIYVVTKGGVEYLFVGDIVWSLENLKREVNRPLLVSLMLREDLDSARGEIRWIIDNLYANPQNTITYVISHDGGQLNEYFKTGVIMEGFK